MGPLQAVKKQQPFASQDVAGIETVLVVDDSRAQRRLVSTYLKRWGYQVLEAENGLDALEMCSEKRVDLVVSVNSR